LGHLLIFLTKSTAILYLLGDNTPIMHPIHFGTEPPDIRIRIQTNPKIRIRIPHHFWLKFWRWRRFAIYECSCIRFYLDSMHNCGAFSFLSLFFRPSSTLSYSPDSDQPPMHGLPSQRRRPTHNVKMWSQKCTREQCENRH